MANIALNKPATASGYVAPFTPAKAVDGSTDPRNRWLCSVAPPPAGSVPPSWLCVDLGAPYWVNRWVVAQMGGAGWQPEQNYDMVDYKLQGSQDNAAWFDMDSVINNSSSRTDRTCAGRLARYVRVYITKGLRSNPSFSSITDLQLYEAANAPYLANLVPTIGALSPGFNQKLFAYTVTVDNGVQAIRFTPTALQANMIVKVKGAVVPSGQQSGDISLNPGDNGVPITVTSADNSMTATYTVNVVRAALSATLKTLDVKNNSGQAVALNPAFQPTTMSYAASVLSGVSYVRVTPNSELSGVAITVNGVSVPNNTQSAPIAMNPGSNTISIVVTAGGYSPGTYTITVTKG